MTIEFACQCGKVYRVHEDDVGKRAKCKEYGRPLIVPAAVEENWCVSSHDGNQYGPVAKSQIDQWVHEGLITPHCQLFRDGDPDWKPATRCYPKLIPPYRAQLTPLPKKTTGSFQVFDPGVWLPICIESLGWVKWKKVNGCRSRQGLSRQYF